MQSLVDKFSNLLHLNAIDQNKQLQFVEKKTGIKPSGFVLATLVFLVIVTLISSATSIVIAIGCVVAPAYFTFLVLETNNKNAAKKYLIYWITYAIMQLLCPLFTMLLPSSIYIALRICITLALLHPESPIADKVYEKGIEPILLKYESEIDKNIDIAMRKGRQGYQKGGDYFQQFMNK